MHPTPKPPVLIPLLQSCELCGRRARRVGEVVLVQHGPRAYGNDLARCADEAACQSRLLAQQRQDFANLGRGA